MMFLKIENPGVCQPEGFTLFGATTKKDHPDKRIIGLFGSGNKHALALCLRMGIDPVVFCGNLRMSFFTRPVKIGETSHQQIYVQYGGTNTDGSSNTAEKQLSVVVAYGSQDWQTLALALREFISNSIDHCYVSGLDHTAVSIEIVDQSKVRAKKGTTRVFIPVTPDVQRFYNELGKWFLHFSEPDLLTQPILPKAGRNRDPEPGQLRIDRAVIYRRGVYVREFTGSTDPSLFDYNLCDLNLNESRTFNDWEAKHKVARCLIDAPPEMLAKVFEAMRAGRHYWELTFDDYGLTPNYADTPEKVDRRKKNWQMAFEKAGGTDAVLVVQDEVGATAEATAAKGFIPVVTKATHWVEAAKQYELPTGETVLSEDDKVGRKFSDATPDVVAALDWVWSVCESVNMTNSKEKPTLRCFYEPLRNGAQTWGFYRNGVVHIHEEIATGMSDRLKVCMMEEVVHHISGAQDFSRDFQTMLVRLVVALANKEHLATVTV